MKVQEANGRQCAQISYNSTQTDLLKSNLKKTCGLHQTFTGNLPLPAHRRGVSILIGAALPMSGSAKQKSALGASLLASYLLTVRRIATNPLPL
jgi:hypothetical protein